VPKAPDGLPHVDSVASGLGQRPLEDALNLPKLDARIERVVAKFAGRPNTPAVGQEFVAAVNRELGLQCGDNILSYLRDLSLLPPAVLERDHLLGAIDRCLAGRLDGHAQEAGLGAALPRPEALDPRRPIDLDALAGSLSGVLDPTQARPPARVRVESTITGIKILSLAPLEAPIGLDYPTWTLLNSHAKEWLLPGAAELEKDSVVALKTNPAFIEAYMVGINTQFLAEMRWRNLPAPRVSTPLRMFWGYVNYETQKREADIRPVRDWPSRPPADPDADDVGDLRHQSFKPGDPSGKEDLVIVFRTALFRRYPSTLVYLVRPGNQDVDTLLKATPNFQESPTNRPARRFFGPIFMGQIEPDLVFFAFDVPPGDLRQYWLVLDEPPSELRFRNDRAPAAPGHSANFANATIDHPTRVAISGNDLEDLGNR
jgi:hypothetical protein